MGARGAGRQAALQILFALEANPSATLEQTVASFWRLTPGDLEGRSYADRAVEGVVADLTSIDLRIRTASANWRLERMSRVDRSVLRLGTWELTRAPDVPRAVVIDEAVELAKRFGSEDSGAFVNGVLDRVADDLGRA